MFISGIPKGRMEEVSTQKVRNSFSIHSKFGVWDVYILPLNQIIKNNLTCRENFGMAN